MKYFEKKSLCPQSARQKINNIYQGNCFAILQYVLKKSFYINEISLLSKKHFFSQRINVQMCSVAQAKAFKAGMRKIKINLSTISPES